MKLKTRVIFVAMMAAALPTPILAEDDPRLEKCHKFAEADHALKAALIEAETTYDAAVEANFGLGIYSYLPPNESRSRCEFKFRVADPFCDAAPEVRNGPLAKAVKAFDATMSEAKATLDADLIESRAEFATATSEPRAAHQIALSNARLYLATLALSMDDRLAVNKTWVAYDAADTARDVLSMTKVGNLSGSESNARFARETPLKTPRWGDPVGFRHVYPSTWLSPSPSFAWRKPGGRGWLPTHGSHRSGHARFGHPAPQMMVSLLNGTHCARLAPRGGDRCCVGARSGPMSCGPASFAGRAICATAVPLRIGIGAAPGSCR